MINLVHGWNDASDQVKNYREVEVFKSWLKIRAFGMEDSFNLFPLLYSFLKIHLIVHYDHCILYIQDISVNYCFY